MGLFDVSGKVAVVTGSSRGIGKASAMALAEQGARVVISSRRQEACDATAAEINDRFGTGSAIAIAANISDKAALQALVDQSRERLGPIDILVCNAATNPHYGSMETISDEQFRKVMDNNVLSNHWLIQMVAPGMKERRDGAIVLISSIGGLRGTETIGVYNISKAADMQLARNLAVEWGPHNIRVNCVAPGLIRTDFARALWEDEEGSKRHFATTPLRRIGEAEEIAGAVVYLASRAGSYTTGTTLVVDGGATI